MKTYAMDLGRWGRLGEASLGAADELISDWDSVQRTIFLRYQSAAGRRPRRSTQYPFKNGTRYLFEYCLNVIFCYIFDCCKPRSLTATF